VRDLTWLGPVPADEPCAQLGDPDYEVVALEECGRYIRRIREVLGPEPEGARLKVKWSTVDAGRYCEVVCEFDDRFPAAFDYALRCESEGPLRWTDG